jgi:hypothetical protein
LTRRRPTPPASKTVMISVVTPKRGVLVEEIMGSPASARVARALQVSRAPQHR